MREFVEGRNVESEQHQELSPFRASDRETPARGAPTWPPTRGGRDGSPRWRCRRSSSRGTMRSRSSDERDDHDDETEDQAHEHRAAEEAGRVLGGGPALRDAGDEVVEQHDGRAPSATPTAPAQPCSRPPKATANGAAIRARRARSRAMSRSYGMVAGGLPLPRLALLFLVHRGLVPVVGADARPRPAPGRTASPR